MENIRNNVINALSQAAELSEEEVLKLLETPSDMKKGDFAFPCFLLAKTLRKAPPAIASDIAAKCGTVDGIETVQAVGPYVNFFINVKSVSGRLIREIIEKGERFGTTDECAGKTVVVEYSSPNIAKPFHFGHLRSTIIGNFLARVHRNFGYRVVSVNYLGDWGKQFGLLSLAYQMWGDDERLRENPVRYLYNLYVRINTEAEANPDIHEQARSLFKRMEAGDTEALQYWQKFYDLSVEQYNLVYKRLGVTFDDYSGESRYNSKMSAIGDTLEQKGLLKESEGAMIVDLEEHGLNVALIKKSDGASLYITRDLAAAIDRMEEFSFEKMFYVVGSEQILHFKQFFKILSLMGHNWAEKCEHIPFGRVKGMSTRKGQAIFLEDVLNEGHQRAFEKMSDNPDKFSEIEDPEKTADICALSALMYADLSNRRIKDYEFDWDRMLSFEGDTGVYLQNAHARISGILRKCGMDVTADCDYSLITEPDAHVCIRKLLCFTDILHDAMDKREACILTTYLFELSGMFHKIYKELRVIGAEEHEAKARLALFAALRQVLGNGMRILGIEPLDRM